MVKSMTGFGRGEYSDGKRSINVEIKGVNHRYCEIYVRLPRRYSFAEEPTKALLKDSVKRGKIEIFVLVENMEEQDSKITLNISAAKQYYESLTVLKKELNLKGEIDIELLSGMPDVLKQIPDVEDEESFLNTLKEALKEAIYNFNEMRLAEGKKLGEDIVLRGNLIKGFSNEIEKYTPEIIASYTERLKERMEDMLGTSINLSEERIATEVAFFADKSNITEELVRLNSHLSQLESIIFEDGQPKGKKLDFLVQELNREANTIGSKTSSIKVTNTVLNMKSEVEKIREQIQNIE